MRNPFEGGCLKIYSPLFESFETIWVKSFTEFCLWITKNGLPDAICFDHDLGKELEIKMLKKGMPKRKTRAMKEKMKTGMDCAKWLVEYCLDNKLELPLYNIQSANTVGKENINGLLKSFNNFHSRK